MRIPILCLLLFHSLGTQGMAWASQPLDLTPSLGAAALTQIRLVYPGCWDGLLLGAAIPHQARTQRKQASATVEIWDLALPESPREEALRLYWQELRQRLSKAFEAPPPSHGFIELGEFMASDPANPQQLDLTKVKSLQERFNRMPPNGSPVKH